MAVEDNVLVNLIADHQYQHIELTDYENFRALSGNDALILWNLFTAVANIYPEVMSSIHKYFEADDQEAAKNAPVNAFHDPTGLALEIAW